MDTKSEILFIYYYRLRTPAIIFNKLSNKLLN